MFFGRIFSVSVEYLRIFNLGLSFADEAFSEYFSKKIPRVVLRYSFEELWNTVAILAQGALDSPSLPHLLTIVSSSRGEVLGFEQVKNFLVTSVPQVGRLGTLGTARQGD